MLVRGPSLEASMSSYLVDQIAAVEHIEVRTCTQVVGASGEDHLEHLTLRDLAAGTEETVDAQWLFVFIGAAPRTDWLEGTVARDARGFVLTGPDLPRRPEGWFPERDPFHLETSVRASSRSGTCAPSRSSAWRPRSGRARWPSAWCTDGWRTDDDTRTRGDRRRAAWALPLRAPRGKRSSRGWSSTATWSSSPRARRCAARATSARCFWVLLSGEFSMSQLVRGDQVEITRSSQPGTYAGSTQAYIPDAEQTYKHTMLATADSRLFALPAAEWAEVLRAWFRSPCTWCRVCSSGCAARRRRSGSASACSPSGSLSAGLTHELNNPAAAASRATGALRDRVAGMRHKLAMLASGKLDGSVVAQLVELQEEAVNRARPPPTSPPCRPPTPRTSWATSSRTAASAARGTSRRSSSRAVSTPPGWRRSSAPYPRVRSRRPWRWIAYRGGDRDAHGRDRRRDLPDRHPRRRRPPVLPDRSRPAPDRGPAGAAEVDAGDDEPQARGHHAGQGVRPGLPPLSCFPAELNQVWTNIVDNAVGAMGGEGTLTLRTRRDGPNAVVEIGDTGPGSPTTSAPASSSRSSPRRTSGRAPAWASTSPTGIVVSKHHGDIRVHTGPGGTTFEVCLPLE